MADAAATRVAEAGLDAVERRFCFAAWPQAFAHASWFDALDAQLGLTVSRNGSRSAGDADRAVAEALLVQAGTGPHAHARIAIDTLPAWALQAHVPMRQYLSIAGALNLLSELVQAVSGDMARHWDAVLGTGVRRSALLLGQTHPSSHLVRESAPLRQQAQRSARSSTEWDRFCLGLGLTALHAQGPAVQARLRLAWPHELRDVEPWPVDAALTSWLDACLDTVAQLPAAPAPAPALEVLA